MSKKKETKTATILIRLNGDETTAALLADGFAPTKVTISRARRNPDDTYDAYEGARIALARLYGKEPFPEAEPKAGPKPTKLRHSRQLRFKVGDLARVSNPMWNLGTYQRDDIVRITEFRPSGYYAEVVKSTGVEVAKGHTPVFLWDTELSPVEKDQPPAGKPFQPSFQVGDIVRTGDRVFSNNCRNCVGKVVSVHHFPECRVNYEVFVFSTEIGIPGKYALQFCHELPDAPAPMTLLYREDKKK